MISCACDMESFKVNDAVMFRHAGYQAVCRVTKVYPDGTAVFEALAKDFVKADGPECQPPRRVGHFRKPSVIELIRFFFANGQYWHFVPAK